jgi:hypothetical protein
MQHVFVFLQKRLLLKENFLRYHNSMTKFDWLAAGALTEIGV